MWAKWGGWWEGQLDNEAKLVKLAQHSIIQLGWEWSGE